jgi:leader peptidase (prepilin peptidase)/N-methyltransferase
MIGALAWIAPPIAIVGAVVGSFLATAAIRHGRNESFLSGRSRCDGCGRPLGVFATLPVLGYTARAGTAACCRSRIDPLHPAGEIAGAAVALAALSFGRVAPALAFGVLGGLLLSLALIDLKTARLPNPLVAGAALGCASLTLLLRPERWPEALIAAVACFVILEAARRGFVMLRGYGGLGGGDVKLLAALALWLGALTPLALLLASVLGLIQATIQRRAEIAFGPHIAAAGCVVGLFAPGLRGLL